MSRRTRILAIFGALATAGALVLSPAFAADTGVPAYLTDGLAECQAQQKAAVSLQEQAWAETCVVLAQRALDAYVAAHPTPTATPTVTPTVLPTSATPGTTTPPATTPPATTTPPASSRACPAFPAIPDASCTGVPPGTVLRECGTNVTIAGGGQWSGCIWRGLLVVKGTGTVIRNSRILGRIDAGDQNGPSDQAGLQLIDSEIDGSAARPGFNAACIGYSDYSLLRVNVHGCGYGANGGSGVTVTDSWLHGWVTFRAGPDGSEDHKDAYISNGGSGVTLEHNNLSCDYDVGNGLCSAAVGLFGDFAAITNVTIRHNLFNSHDGYCIYGGNNTGKPYPQASNVRIENNLFGRTLQAKCGYYGPVTDTSTTRGNTFIGNTWTDGTPVTG